MLRPGRTKSGHPRRCRIARRRTPAEDAHPVKMLLGELQVAAGGVDIGAMARLIEFGERATGMVADFFVHGLIMIRARPVVLDLDQAQLNL